MGRRQRAADSGARPTGHRNANGICPGLATLSGHWRHRLLSDHQTRTPVLVDIFLTGSLAVVAWPARLYRQLGSYLNDQLVMIVRLAHLVERSL